MAPLLTVRCTPFYMRHTKKGQAREPALCSNTIPRFLGYSASSRGYADSLSLRRIRHSVYVKLLGLSCLLCADVGDVFREGVLLIFAESPGRFKMIVVDKGVHG